MRQWSEVQIKLSEILKLTNEKPLFGHRSGMRTHWLTFMKGDVRTQIPNEEDYADRNENYRSQGV